MKPIHIITVSDGKLPSLKKTMESVDSQKFRNFKNLIISKKKIKKLEKKYKKSQRILIYKKDSSIYEAMNYGLYKSKYNPVIFLNAGDTFCNDLSLKIIAEYISKYSKSCLMFISLLKNEKDYFKPKKKVFFSKHFLTHSSFVRPPYSNDIGFEIRNKVTADGDWMKSNIEKFSIKKIYKETTLFYLGGISNLPSKKSISMKFNTGIISISKELIKLLLLKLINQNLFYKIIYFFKYNRLTLNEIKKSTDSKII